MLTWLMRRIDRRCDALEREVEELTRELDEVHSELSDEIADLRYQVEHSVKNLGELQVEHMRRVIALEDMLTVMVRAGARGAES